MESLENSLVNQLSQLTTDDHETLLRKFKEIIFPKIIPNDLAAFYLDLANWNLSTALTVFYDQNGDLEHMEEAFKLATLSSSIRDCTNPNAVSGGQVMLPRQIFECSWTVENNGRFTWPPGTRIVHVDGDPIDYETLQEFNLNPGEAGLVTLKVCSPQIPGDYKARFQFVTTQNVFFGESIWVFIHVASRTPSHQDCFIKPDGDSSSQMIFGVDESQIYDPHQHSPEERME